MSLCIFFREVHPLKYGFCKKSLRKNETLTSWTLLAHFFSRSALISTDLEKKWAKSVQLFRVSFFLSDFLQNPYFSITFSSFGEITSEKLQQFLFELYLDYVISCIFIACFYFTIFLPIYVMNLSPFGPNEPNVSTAMEKKILFSFWGASHMCHFAGKVARKISSNLFLKKKEKLLNSNGNMFNSTKSWTALRDKWSQLRPPLDITMISKGNTYFELKNSPFFNALEGFRPCLFVNLLFLYVILFLEASEGFLKLAKTFIHLQNSYRFYFTIYSRVLV